MALRAGEREWRRRHRKSGGRAAALQNGLGGVRITPVWIDFGAGGACCGILVQSCSRAMSTRAAYFAGALSWSRTASDSTWARIIPRDLPSGEKLQDWMNSSLVKLVS